MKTIGRFLLLSWIMALACTQAGPSHIKLSDNWTLQQQGDPGKEYPARVPSTVMGVLRANGLYSDIFLDDNYLKAGKSLFDSVWKYTTRFSCDLSRGKYVTLRFEGLNYYSDIRLNGSQIASADTAYGVFRTYTYDVTPLVKHNNILEVELSRALPGDLNIGFVDWNPRPLDESMGIVRDVTLKTTGSVRIDNPFVKPSVNLVTLEEADLTVTAVLVNLSEETVSGTLKGTIGGKVFRMDVTLQPKECKTVAMTSESSPELHFDHPRLWWCHTMGTPELYELTLDFIIDNELSDTENVTFGIREIDSYLTADQHRGFRLNGREVLLTSAGWTDRIFLDDTPEDIDIQLRYVKDMNLNSVRFENIWGTDHTLYDLCDRYGLLALVGWSCFWEWESYSGVSDDEYGSIKTQAQMDLAVKYWHDQVIRLRNHPSVFAWMAGSDKLPRPELEKRYLDLYSQLDYRPYVGAAGKRYSELSGPTGTKMAGPYEYVGPSYWFTDTANGGAFGFNTETGIGAQLPVIESLKKMISPENLWPVSKMWNVHCTTSATAMNSMDILTGAMNAKYGEASSLEEYMKKAHALNYEGTKAMFEAFRANIPNTTGIVQWMLNSAWPSLYWQLYDYYLIPTAGYYGVKKANNPLQLIYNYKDRSVYAVNETGQSTQGQNLRSLVTLMDAQCRILLKEEKALDVPVRNPVRIANTGAYGQDRFLSLKITDSTGTVLTDNFYCLPARDDVFDWDATTWFYTPVKTYADMQFVSALPPVEVHMETEQDNAFDNLLLKVMLENTSDWVTYMNTLTIKDETGEIIYPAFWSDNYFSMIPGDKCIVTCSVPAGKVHGKSLTLILDGWNTQRVERYLQSL